MRVLITGANGFLGKNLQLHLSQRHDVEVKLFTLEHSLADLKIDLKESDFVFHLAGVNRADNPQDFFAINEGLTKSICDAIVETGRIIPVLYTSSIHAERDDSYGSSKRQAENALFELQTSYAVPVYVFRLPNIFGKWCKPNYNSVVATFCHNLIHDLPIEINKTATLQLIYVDDVIKRFIECMDFVDRSVHGQNFISVGPQYEINVDDLAKQLNAFKKGRSDLQVERVGEGLLRALYSTFVSYLPVNYFSYKVPQYEDSRGIFVEMIKTPDCGQVSYFTSKPGVTRGGHYHHSKTEKFLVIKGYAFFKFRHMHTGEIFELSACAGDAQIIQTIPGWAHDITNVGDDELVVMLWANEQFDKAQPDTFQYEL
jgi:UDP-2-acetamido-2,6-beta-L-arabino-hexul-4-ose reductase